jgi:glucose-fructose oxidoreductase
MADKEFCAMRKNPPTVSGRKKVRYAVVGLGHIAQVAVLPAFAHARNSRLAALVSSDPVKLEELSAQYGVDQTYRYEDYDACLASGEIDAVYIALPNNMHCDYAVRAARAGIHVLCEKPMGVTTDECQQMIDAAQDNSVRMMIAYRLHFEEANLKAIEIIESGQIGEPRLFASVFSMQVREGDIRLQRALGGGTVYDIGIYCINAARYLFRDEPTEVFAYSARKRDDPRFAEVDEMTSVVLRFPGERLANFTSSFGASDVSAYRVVGTEGELRVDPAYEHSSSLVHHLTIEGKTKKRSFPKRDQFGPELTYFSRCILSGFEPEPNGHEGLADVRIIEAIYESARTGKPVRLPEFHIPRRPSLEQEIHYPPAKKAELVHTESPSL